MQQDQVGPAFPRALRGYAPGAVDARLTELEHGLRAAEARAAAAVRDRDAAAQERETATRERDDAARERDDAARERDAAVQRAADAERARQAGGQPRPVPAPPGPAPTGPGPAPLSVRVPPSAPPRRAQRTTLLAAGLALLLGLGVGAGAALLLDDDPAPAAAAPAPTEPDTLGASPPTVTGEPLVPEGWTRFTSPDGSSLALPPDWKQEGIASGTRWVSVSGASEVRVITAPADDPAALEDEIARRPGYERLGGGDTSVRGEPAYVFDYLVRDGATAAVQGSDQAVVVGGTGYLLHVQSREDVWPTLAPLLPAIRGSFVPAG